MTQRIKGLDQTNFLLKENFINYIENITHICQMLRLL